MKTNCRKFRFLVNAFLCLSLLAALLSHPITSYAASDFKSSNLRYGLNKGKEVTIQSYVSGVGLRNVKVKLSKYSVKNETIRVNGKKIKTKRIKASVVFTTPTLTAKESKKFLNSDKNSLANYKITTINTKTGKFEPAMKETNYKWVGGKKIERHGVYYYDKCTLHLDINVKASNYIAIGAIGYTRKSFTDQGNSKTAAFINKKIPITKTYNYDKNNKMLSIWKKVK